MEVKCVCVCVCVHANWLKGGAAVGVAFYEKAHNFQMDSQSCKRFGGKFGHEPSDSWSTVQANRKKGDRQKGA